jgi:LuxR family maltose regulon positive regulatory protein
VRTFINLGAPMEQLLRQAAPRGIEAAYVTKLLQEMQSHSRSARRAPSVVNPTDHPSVIEPLTDREKEVLDLVGRGFSNKDIACELVISVGTVKNHLKRIYGKLDVHNRTRAVHQARILGFL